MTELEWMTETDPRRLVNYWAQYCGPQTAAQLMGNLLVMDMDDVTRCFVVRDLVGNPFRPVAVREPCWDCQGYGTHLGAGPDRGNPRCATCNGSGQGGRPSWLTAAVRNFAAGVDEQGLYGDPEAMALLADLLETEGCVCGPLLEHLRGWEACPILHAQCTFCDGTGRRALPGHWKGCWSLRLLLEAD